MRDFLLFTLWGPLAAAGEVAVGERRTGWDRPGRSAVLGMVAAALGIDRQEETALAALDAGYGYAVRVEAEGVLLEDYHTAQVPPARKGRRWPTRRAELAEPGLETVLSLRDYRTDARHTVALWGREEPPHPLERLAEALRRPRFVLYLGRRSCPLGLPPAPRIVSEATLAEAFARFDRETPPAERRLREAIERADPRGRQQGGGATPGWVAIYADADAAHWPGPGLRHARTVHRRDVPLSRLRWQFGLREELVFVPETTR